MAVLITLLQTKRPELAIRNGTDAVQHVVERAIERLQSPELLPDQEFVTLPKATVRALMDAMRTRPHWGVSSTSEAAKIAVLRCIDELRNENPLARNSSPSAEPTNDPKEAG